MKKARLHTALKSLVVTTVIASVGAAHAEQVFSQEQLRLPGKRGACFTLRDPAKSNKKGLWTQNLPKLKKLQPYWNYSWGADYVEEQPAYIKSEFVPMIWAARDPARLDKTLKSSVIPEIKRGRVKRILAFNEPDGEKQANMTPEEALKFWPQLEKLQIPICSPAAVHADRGWMATFMEGAKKKNYRIDYIGVHSYGGTSASSFKKRMRKIYELHGKRPLLITEFAAADWKTKGDHRKNRHSAARVMAFAKDVLPWIEEQDWILGYAWYSFGLNSANGYTSALFDADGNLTALGRYYASITKENPKGDQSIEPDNTEELLATALKAARSK